MRPKGKILGLAVWLAALAQMSIVLAVSTFAASYTGWPILTGSCTIPTLTSVLSTIPTVVTISNTALSGSSTPLLRDIIVTTAVITVNFYKQGCSEDQPSCCPFSITSSADFAAIPTLTACPPQYTLINSESLVFCCPIGFMLLPPTAYSYAEHPPCVVGYATVSGKPNTFTTFTINDVATGPGGLLNDYVWGNSQNTTMELEILVTESYAAPGPKKKLSAGGIVGAVIPSAVSAITICLAVYFGIKRWRRRRHFKTGIEGDLYEMGRERAQEGEGGAVGQETGTELVNLPAYEAREQETPQESGQVQSAVEDNGNTVSDNRGGRHGDNISR